MCYIHVIRLYDHIKCKLIKFSQVFSDISFIFLILKIILALFIVSATFFEKCYYKSHKKHLNYQVPDQTVLIICFSALSNLQSVCESGQLEKNDGFILNIDIDILNKIKILNESSERHSKLRVLCSKY